MDYFGMAGGSITDMRRRNRHMVLREIASSTPMSRSKISERTGLTGAAVSRITRELIDVGIISEGMPVKVKGQVGRRNIQLTLSGEGAFVLGIALAANIQSISIGNGRGEIVGQRQISGLDLSDPMVMVEQLSLEANELIRSANIEPARVVGCGLVVGGVADSSSGMLIRSDPLGWKDMPLASLLSEKLGLPIRLESRAVAILLAEQKHRSTAAKKNVVLISNWLWVGGAMMLDGSVVKGQSNMIGQIGHFSLKGNEEPCICGRVGCLDAVASGQAILRKLQHIRLPENAKYKEPRDRLLALIQRDGSKNPEISAAFLEAGRNMGYAVDALLSILNPEQILLTGATHRQPDYVKGILETLAIVRPEREDWQIIVSQVTSDQSAIWLGLNAFVFSPSLDVDKLKKA